MRKIAFVAGGLGFALGVTVTLCIEARMKAPPLPVEWDSRRQIKNLIVRRYDVSDLAIPFVIPPSSTSNYANQNPQGQAGSPTYDLIDFIRETVAPESWQSWSTGGFAEDGIAYPVGGHMFVVQTPENHHKIQRLLKELRSVSLEPILPPLAASVPAIGADGLILSDVPQASALRAPIKSIEFRGLPLDDAVADLTRQSGVPIQIDHASFLSYGGSTKVAVSLSLRDASLTDALDAILSKPLADMDASYGIVHGGVLITDRENAARMLVSTVYDIRDLVPPQFSQEEASERFVETLCDTIAPETWRQSGGMSGTIHNFNGIVIITQTWSVQEQIRSFLQRLQKGGVRLPPTTRPAIIPVLRP